MINQYSKFTGLLVLIFITSFLSSSTLFAIDNKWYSFNEGLKKASNEDKSVLVDFYADWCHWCKVMDQKTFQEAKVSKKLQERFVTIKLNAEDQASSVTYKNISYTNPQLTQAFGVTGFPSLAFLDSKGEVITLIPGYVPAEEFINVLEYIDQKLYEKNVSFDDFLKKQKKS